MLNKRISIATSLMLVAVLSVGCSNEADETSSSNTSKNIQSSNSTKNKQVNSKKYVYFKEKTDLSETEQRYLNDFNKKVNEMISCYENGEVFGTDGEFMSWVLGGVGGGLVGALLEDEDALKIMNDTKIELVDSFYKEYQGEDKYDGNYAGPTALLKIKYPAVVDTVLAIVDDEYIKENSNVKPDNDLLIGECKDLLRMFNESDNKIYKEEYFYIYSKGDYVNGRLLEFSDDLLDALSGQLYNYEESDRVGISSSDTFINSIEKSLTNRLADIAKNKDVKLEIVPEDKDLSKILEYMASNTKVKVLSSTRRSYWAEDDTYSCSFTATLTMPNIKDITIESLLSGKTSEETIDIILKKIKDGSIDTIQTSYLFDGTADQNENLTNYYTTTHALDVAELEDILLVNSLYNLNFFKEPKINVQKESDSYLSEKEILKIYNRLLPKVRENLIKHGIEPKTTISINSYNFDALTFDKEAMKSSSYILSAGFAPTKEDDFVNGFSFNIKVPYDNIDTKNFKFEESLFVDFFKIFHEGDMPKDFSATNAEFIKELNSEDPFMINIVEGTVPRGVYSNLGHSIYFGDDYISYSVTLDKLYKTYNPN